MRVHVRDLVICLGVWGSVVTTTRLISKGNRHGCRVQGV